MSSIKSYEKNKHLIGEQINNWKILDIIADSDKTHTYAIAQCKCGTIKELRLSYIINNKIIDCGCGFKERQKEKTLKKYEYLINTSINGWTILNIIPPDENHKKTFAMCKCQCGTIKEVRISYILDGRSKDCGCGRKNTISNLFSKDLVGQRFGKLLVVENIEGRSKTGRKLYKCLCDCGNEIILHTNQLTTHHTNSCGCLLSYYNMCIKQWLTDNKIKFKAEYTIRYNCTTYRFDFFLPDYNLFIEYDGKQHFEPVRYYTQSDEEMIQAFQETQKRDAIKNKYCEENNINLLRIPYWEKDNIETIIINHLQRLNEKGFANIA